MDSVLMWSSLRSPDSFGSIRHLQRYSGRSEREVNKLPATQAAYIYIICFPCRKTYWKGIGDLFQIDLVDLSSLSSFNDGIRYLLTYIDVFSKRAWAVPDRKSPLETSPKLSKRF